VTDQRKHENVYTQSKYNASNASFSNYRKDKLGINANLSGGENIKLKHMFLETDLKMFRMNL
jgi:hypothetical protein